MKTGFFVPIKDRGHRIDALSRLHNVHFVENGSHSLVRHRIIDTGKPYVCMGKIGHLAAHNACLDWAGTLGFDRICIMHSDDYPVLEYNGEKLFADTGVGFTFGGYVVTKKGLVDRAYTATRQLDNKVSPAKQTDIDKYTGRYQERPFANTSTWVWGPEAMEMRYDLDYPYSSEAVLIWQAHKKGIPMHYRSAITTVVEHSEESRITFNMPEQAVKEECDRFEKVRNHE